MAEERNSLKFWQLLIIVTCCIISYAAIYYSTLILIVNNNSSSFYHVVHVLATALNFVPYIIYITRKTKIKLSDYLALPNIATLIKVIIISALIRFVIVIPFDNPGTFFNLLKDSTLRFYTLSLDISIPGIAVALRWALIPLVEEILFRGLILTLFLKIFTPPKAILLNTFIFSLYHVNLSWFFGLFIMGLVLCVIFYKTNSILISTFSHYILYNGLLKIESLEYNRTWELLVYFSIYVFSVVIVILLLRKPMNTLKVKTTPTSEIT